MKSKQQKLYEMDRELDGWRVTCQSESMANQRARGVLVRIRKECFYDSKWAKIIDKVLNEQIAHEVTAKTARRRKASRLSARSER